MTARKKMPRLRVGQVWEARNGRVVRISRAPFPFADERGLTYTPEGTWASTPGSENDLIRLLSQPKPRAKKRGK